MILRTRDVGRENEVSTKNFKNEEFECKCGCGKNEVSQKLLEKLQLARELANVPFKITSGYRCETHNKNVGGVTGSTHTLGLAADIEAVGKNRIRILVSLARFFDRIGIANNFIHVDIDKSKPEAIWEY